MQLNNNSFDLATPAIMGILNVTPDSFSDGGEFNQKDMAINRAFDLTQQGADIIDIGAESTRPGSKSISADEELKRILPVLDELPKDRFIISIDSNKPSVQKECIQKGAHIINDVFGGSNELFELAEKYQVGLILMHTTGTPEVMQSRTTYADVVADILHWMEEKNKIVSNYNIPAVWFDPGVGFGKTLEQNLLLMGNIKQFTDKGFPILLGSSRKSWIEKLTGADIKDRLAASIISGIEAVNQGCEILRVHDVFETKQALVTHQELKKFSRG